MEELKWRPSGWTCPWCYSSVPEGGHAKCGNCGRYANQEVTPEERTFSLEEYKIWREGIRYRASNK